MKYMVDPAHVTMFEMTESTAERYSSVLRDHSYGEVEGFKQAIEEIKSSKMYTLIGLDTLKEAVELAEVIFPSATSIGIETVKSDTDTPNLVLSFYNYDRDRQGKMMIAPRLEFPDSNDDLEDDEE